MTRAAGLAAVLWAALTVPAHAWVRQVTSDGTGIAWKSGCVFLTPDAAGTKDLSFAMVMPQIQAAANNWLGVTSSCSYLKVNVDPPATGKTAALDGINLTLWLPDKWGRTVNGMFMAYSPEVPAQTTIIFVDDRTSNQNGQILDADTELNSVDFQFGIFQAPPAQCSLSPCVMDIQNTLTHEYGHVVGLDHTCYAGDVPNRPIDNNGNPVPTCGTPEAETTAVLEATMYNFACCGEIKKRTPESDDINGYCGIYPPDNDPNSCARVQPHGLQSGCAACAVGSRPPPWGATLAVLALTVLACTRTRRRSGCAPASCDRPRSSGAA
jgi:hypothetical protein